MRHARFAVTTAALLGLMLLAAPAIFGSAGAQAPRKPPADSEAEDLPPPRESLPPGENLLLTPPAGWELGFSDRDDDQSVYEYLPAGQELENWGELMTVQVFFELRNVPPRAVLERMRKGFEQSCDSPGAETAAERPVSGYPAARQLLLCGRNREGGGKGEVALIQAVSGRDALYVVQRAWRGDAFRGAAPAAARTLLPGWHEYLDKVRVCDTRDKAKPCSQ